MTMTIAGIQDKLISKLEQKWKGGITKEKLRKMWTAVDADNDGFVSMDEFNKGLSFNGNALSDQEAFALFIFYDTMAESQPAQGAVEIDLAANDLIQSIAKEATPFNSGLDFKDTTKQARGNQPSQAGGIFGGGSYEADANFGGPAAPPPRPVLSMAPPQPEASPYVAVSSRPKGNQSSIAGGIFGASADPAPPPSSRSNRSNQSSIAGGIFGEGPEPTIKAPAKYNSNRSSVPGGIFG